MESTYPASITRVNGPVRFAARFLAALLLLTTLCLGASAQAPGPALDQSGLSTYQVVPEDQLSITTRDIAEASGSFLVRSDGFITFPIIGDVKVAGLTTDEISKLLAKRLSKELNNPVITVNITALGARRIYVMGAIGKPGVLEWKPGWRLTEIIASAGGLTDPPEHVNIYILRGAERIKPISASDLLTDVGDVGNVEIQPGDFLNFQSDITVRVQIVGQVAKEGTTTVIAGQGIVEAVAAAGGPSGNARLSAAKIVRAGHEIPVDLYKAITLGDNKLDVPLKEGDTIYVPALTEHIAVLGSVGKPGSMPIPDGKVLTLSEAVAEAGGPVSEAKIDQVTLIHAKDIGKTKPEQYDFKAIIKGGKNVEDPVLVDGDIVFVSQSGKPHTGDFLGIVGLWQAVRFLIP